ncbi:Endopolygalacturonase [Apiospora kogelbergensis]|uniref:endo-polygalacturonase n=1 Tax=Apiospora kogelbergensis TaxID=1337665 RepID=A0AAW0QA91_9PEZI
MYSKTILGLCAAAATMQGAAAMPASKAVKASAADCTFTDAAAAMKGKSSCTNIVLDGISVPAGTTLDMTGLKDGTHVTFKGTTSFGFKAWAGPLLSFSGNNLLIDGASGHVIDGNGGAWWDTKGSNGGVKKPKFFYAHKLTDSNIKGLNVKNTPVQGFSINGAKNLGLYDITIDNSAGDTKGGHNTDAFDVGSSDGVYISGANVQNQDDCLAVNSGTNITFTGGKCSGGHGVSIGSVGGRSDNVVKGVHVLSTSISNSDNGVRIKTVSGATGSVSGVEYKDITLTNIAKYGIVIQQDYENGSPTGTPTGGVPITDLTISGVTGSVASKADPIYILCAKGACSNWKWSGVKISGGQPNPNKCLNVPSPASC